MSGGESSEAVLSMHHLHHDPLLMGLSLILAVLASHVGLDLVRREKESIGRSRMGWIAAGATTMGMGIWSMHFVAMLAFRFPVPASYDIGLTAASAILAIAGAACCFLVVARSRGFAVMTIGGGLMGIAIAAMHYIGMAAIMTPGHVSHDWSYVILSILIAIVASGAALMAAFGPWRSIPLPVASLVMGMAVAGMHYTAMLGYELHPTGSTEPAPVGMDPNALALLVAGANFVILFMGLVSAQFDRSMLNRIRQEKEDIRRQKDFAAGLLEASNDPILAVDAHMRITAWNKAMEQVAGIPSAEALGRRFDETPACLPDIAHGISEARAGNPSRLDVECHGRSMSVSLFPLESAASETGALIIMRDETDLVQMREAVRHAQRMDALGQMTGSVAHDFNNLLMVIDGTAKGLQKQLPDSKEVETIIMAATRGNGLIRKLLAFSRRQNLQPQTIDLHQRLNAAIPLIRSAAGSTVRIDLSVSSELPLVTADPNELEIALINLVVNAKDASPGGGTVRIEARAVERGIVEISVSDEGEGMDADTIAKAFDPFFTTKEAGKGSGLGLSQVYGFARQSGGTARIRSTPGSGTTVSIQLPASTEPMRTAAPDSDLALVLHHHPDVAQTLVDSLVQMGLACTTCEDAGMLLDEVSAAKGNIALVIVDAGSTMDASALVAAVRRRCPLIPCALISNHEMAKAPVGAMLLDKPYSMSALEQIVQRRQTAQMDGELAANA